MIWLITTDTAYYSTEQKVKAYIKEQTTIKSDIQIKVLPTRYEILACIKQATTQPFVMVSNMPPPDDLENFFYVLKRLDTSRLQDELIGLNDREKLTNALKMSVYDCKLNFDGFIGRELLKEKIKAYDNGVFFFIRFKWSG